MHSSAGGPESTGWSHRPPGSSGRHPRPSLPGHTGLHRWSCAGRCPPRRNTGTRPGTGGDAIGHVRDHLREHPSTGPREPRCGPQPPTRPPRHRQSPARGDACRTRDPGPAELVTAVVGTATGGPPARSRAARFSATRDGLGSAEWRATTGTGAATPTGRRRGGSLGRYERSPGQPRVRGAPGGRRSTAPRPEGAPPANAVDPGATRRSVDRHRRPTLRSGSESIGTVVRRAEAPR